MSAHPTGMVAKIIELLRNHPEGLTSGEIREKLGVAAHEQAQLDRRRRQVREWYELITIPSGSTPKYQLGAQKEVVQNTGAINGRLRAEVLRTSRGRCQMCGRSVAEDAVKLQIDHKVPQTWGGTNDIENLWALCTECNHGKKDLFASQDDGVKELLQHGSVHVRIGELLKLNLGKPVSSRLIDFVANQDDWKKRTRELRYLGWDIEVTKKKQPNGRVMSFYQLNRFTDWPTDPTGWIRQYEKEREIANQKGDNSAGDK